MGWKRWLAMFIAVFGLGVSAGCASAPEARSCDGRQSCGAASIVDAGAAAASEPQVSDEAATESSNVLPDQPAGSQEGALQVHFQDAQGAPIETIVLACEACVDVEVVVRGGNPPYVIEWDDGSTQAVRRVCAATSSSLSARVSDTAVETAEFQSPAQTVIEHLETLEGVCGEDGACARGPGPQTPRSGRYEGSGTYVCDNDTNAQAAVLINHLELSLDFAIDANSEEQRGHAFLQWGLVVIVGAGELSGSLECSGALRAALREGSWGVPGNEPMSLIPAGTLSGEFTARATADPNAISGSWTWTSMSATGEYGNTCNGNYEAQLVP